MRTATSFKNYLNQHPKWHDGIMLLQEIILKTGMEETIKWGAPVYTFNKKNLVSIGAFKNHLSLWFFIGSFLKDDANLLLKVQDKTKNMRHLRYHDNNEIDVKIVKYYCLETIKHLKEGKVAKIERINKPLIIPEEMATALENDPSFKDSFKALSLSKRREYALYISEAKQDKTKQSRLEKITPMILEQKGLNDKYK